MQADNGRTGQLQRLPVQNPILKRLLLGQIVTAIDERETDALSQAGLSPWFLDAIRHRQARDLFAVARDKRVRCWMLFDEKEMLASLTLLDSVRRDDALYAYFVRNGATVQLICTLFRKSADEVRALRAQLLPKAELTRKARMPAPDLRDRVHQRWHEINRSAGKYASGAMRERLYALHQSFPEYRLDALCRTLNEFSGEVSRATSSTASMPCGRHSAQRAQAES